MTRRLGYCCGKQLLLRYGREYFGFSRTNRTRMHDEHKHDRTASCWAMSRFCAFLALAHISCWGQSPDAYQPRPRPASLTTRNQISIPIHSRLRLRLPWSGSRHAVLTLCMSWHNMERPASRVPRDAEKRRNQQHPLLVSWAFSSLSMDRAQNEMHPRHCLYHRLLPG